MAGIGIERGLDPGETLLSGERFGLLLHFRGGEVFEQRHIDPGFAIVVVEQLTLDAPAGGDVRIAADKPCSWIAAPDSPGEDHAPDAVWIGGIVGRGQLLEDAGLDLLIRGCAEGLGNVESDLAGGQCLEYDGRKRREAQTALDEADGQTEAASNVLDSRTACHERGKSLGFIGGAHGEAVEVLREAGLDRGFGTVFEHEARDFVIAREELFVRERQHRTTTALARFHLKLAFGSGSNDEVLQQTMRSNAGLEFGICCRVTVTADITGRLNELVQRDRFDHGTALLIVSPAHRPSTPSWLNQGKAPSPLSRSPQISRTHPARTAATDGSLRDLASYLPRKASTPS